MTRLGLISDTHGHLDPRIPELFQGVDHILHAGDIGPASLIAELEQIAPVTAVLGNNDWDERFRETEVVELAGCKFLIHHIVEPHRPGDTVKRLLARHRPAVVIFGHTHRPHDSMVDGVRFINPGYAGKPRFNQPRSVALLECGSGGLRLETLLL